MTSTSPSEGGTRRQQVEAVIVRLAGDSGDGIQLTGSRMSETSALAGNDVATLPDYPAEIRAPAGTLPGVSGFQLQFASKSVLTPGDEADVLVAFNPAALRMHLSGLKKGGILIVNSDAFDGNNLRKAGYQSSPLEGHELEGYRVYPVGITSITRQALAETELSVRERDRCKNFFALGMLYWLYSRPLGPTLEWLRRKFASSPSLAEANEKVLRAGYNYAETARIFQTVYEVAHAPLPAGLYRNLDGNEAIALALASVAHQSGLQVFLGSYPITPASTVLHRAGRLKAHGVVTFQAEDEMAAVGAALGASFAGALGVTSTSGPGLALKGEMLGLAVMMELPLLVICVQRGGPSTGLPTKTEQADLDIALHGRHGESPLPVLAAASPGDCFHMVFEAARLAIRHMTPVILLSDGYIANGAEPFRVPAPEDLPPIPVAFHSDPESFRGTYVRDARTGARPWVRPGTPGLEHRVGGLEKDEQGAVSYDPRNHERMVAARAAKVAAVAEDLPPATFEEGEAGGDLLIVGWGSTWGAITQATRELRREGRNVASVHLRYLHPLPRGLEAILREYSGRILLPELNRGQLRDVLTARYNVAIEGLQKIQGQPFRVAEIKDRARSLLEEKR
ncbi:MAG: 2-oxoacid:acceptor oxidoreductase subunit alpha [Acidobacteriota bacterium]|nr:2-oxoacid:acceptor oxidoreductase subunit alpha [Acidobacteriota bacterium]